MLDSNCALNRSCRMPEEKGDEMAECDVCHVWYHRHCMDIPSEVFGEVEVTWECKRCVKAKLAPVPISSAYFFHSAFC